MRLRVMVIVKGRARPYDLTVGYVTECCHYYQSHTWLRNLKKATGLFIMLTDQQDLAECQYTLILNSYYFLD